MTLPRATLCLLAIWAGIYLPALGTTEIKGEEGRRIFPALAMLDSGDWLVPQLAGEAYLRKPPLINWSIALAMQMTGRRDEWAARLPSVLGALALGLVVVWATASWLRPGGALMAAIFAMANISLIEKGRLAEIEALYVAFTGMAMVWWMRGFRLQANRWVTWLGCGVFLGLGLLTKGPLHLLFFYALVISVYLRERSGREFFNWAHLAGLLVAVSLFAAWMTPYLQATPGGEATATWQAQFVERITENQFDFGSWLLSVPRGLSNFLPWVVLAPLLWYRSPGDALPPREASLLRGGRDTLAVLYVGMLLIPGVLVRYTMPMLPALGVLLALALRDRLPGGVAVVWKRILFGMLCLLAVASAIAPLVGGWSIGGGLAAALGLILCLLVWKQRRSWHSAPSFTAASAALMVVITLVYAAAVVPRMTAQDDVRPVAPKIEAMIPPGQTLHVLDINYQPELFYLRRPVKYHAEWKEVPESAEWVLIRSRKRKDAAKKRPEMVEAGSFPVSLDKPLVLLRRGE